MKASSEIQKPHLPGDADGHDQKNPWHVAGDRTVRSGHFGVFPLPLDGGGVH